MGLTTETVRCCPGSHAEFRTPVCSEFLEVVVGKIDEIRSIYVDPMQLGFPIDLARKNQLRRIGRETPLGRYQS